MSRDHGTGLTAYTTITLKDAAGDPVIGPVSLDDIAAHVKRLGGMTREDIPGGYRLEFLLTEPATQSNAGERAE